MELFDFKNGQLASVELKPFALEKEIQSLVEKNASTIFSLDFIRSEFQLGNYRIDTLCFDKENNSFVIIEYKKGNSYSVIDQGYTYLQLLLNNKSDFILALSQHLNKVLRNEDIDWSQSKIIFISPSFNNYQKDSVNFKNLPFELWEVKRFSNNTVIFNKHQSSSRESIESLSNASNQNVINSVNKEVKVVDEAFHVNKCVPALVQKWEELKEKLLDLPNTQLVPKSPYISLMYENKTICYFNFRKSAISIDIGRGNLTPNGDKSKNYFDLDDPKSISKEGSWEWKSGVKGTIYKIPLNTSSDLDYLIFLIKQKYTNSIR
jgi:hypothetical protein